MDNDLTEGTIAAVKNSHKIYEMKQAADQKISSFVNDTTDELLHDVFALGYKLGIEEDGKK